MNEYSNAYITKLINAYDKELRGVLLRRCGCVETAADILQETYKRLITTGIWERAENPRALLHRIAANLATDHERRNAVRDKYISAEEAIPGTVEQPAALQPECILSTHQRLDRLAQAVEQLSPKCRTAFVLRKAEGLSQSEIAERMGISRNMVEKHLRRAMQALQQVQDD